MPNINTDDLTANMNSDILSAFRNQVQPYMELMACYKCAIMEIETKFKVLNEEFSLQYDRNPIETIKTRLKSPKSILEKIHKKDLPLTAESIEENITDIAGVRVICSFQSDIYLLANCLLKQDDVILIKKKDYILNPKENGYRSLHLIIQTPIFLKDKKKFMNVEIQFRTIAMDFWASLEHKLKYKKNVADAERLTSELKECADTIHELDTRMQQIRMDIEDDRC